MPSIYPLLVSMIVRNKKPHGSSRRGGASALLVIALIGWNAGAAAYASFKQGGVHPQEAAPATFSYDVRPDFKQTTPVLHITFSITLKGDEDQITLQMPAWSPGDYHIQHHGRYVQALTAQGEAPGAGSRSDLKITHPNDDEWIVQTAGVHTVTVAYMLPTTPPGIFSENVKIEPHYIFVNGPSAFLYLAGHRASAPITLTLHPPTGWKAETSLDPAPAPDPASKNSLRYTAPDYDTLADSPFVLGDPTALTTGEFTISGIPIRTAFFHQITKNLDPDHYTPILKPIVEAEARIMGGLPNRRYLFLFDVGGDGGALEHLNSTRVPLFPSAPDVALESYVSHEFFHLWNVKRIRPKVLGPFDYIHPPHTHNIWFAEGVTEYYAGIARRRAGLMSVDQFRNRWRRAIAEMQQNPARLKVTADEVSFRIWESGDSEEFGGLSYYEKGQLIGLCMDLKIREATQGRKSLDDMMRLLMKRHAPPRPGYEEDELRAVLSEVAGQDLSAFYDLLARSTQEMPFADCLSYVGLDPDLKPLPAATPEQIALRDAWEKGP